VQNLEIIQVRDEDNILLIKGSVPGSKGDYVVIRGAKKGLKQKAAVAPKAAPAKGAKPAAAAKPAPAKK
jgi:large subunit ribosomal protein L3